MALFLSIFLLLSLFTENTEALRDTIRLEEVEILSHIKENGGMRQQPSAVTLITQQELEASHITSLKAASALVPNLFIPDYGSRMTSAIYIRGIGSRINTPSVGLYVDDVPYADKSAFDFNFYDIERIDVLRGPQGTLYGRNTMGGLVKVYTRNPFYYSGTDVKLGMASGDTHRSASLSHYHRVSDQMAFSAGGYYEGSDGFFRNGLTGKKADGMESGGGRIRAIWLPATDWKMDLTLGYDYSDEGAYPYYYTGNIGATSAEKDPYAQHIGQISNNRESRYRRGLFNAGLNLEYKADRWQMNAITGYQQITDRMFMDQDFLSDDIYTLEQRQRIHTFTEEITFKNRGTSRWQWISGVNFMYQSLHTEGPVHFFSDGLRWLESNVNSNLPDVSQIPSLSKMGFTGMGVNFRGDDLLMGGSFDTPTLGFAAFHQSSINLTDKLLLTAGIRLDYEHLQMDYNAPAHVDFGFRMPNPRVPMMNLDLQDLSTDLLYEGQLQNDRFRLLPKLSLKYDFTQSSNVYTSFSMGQRSGGYNVQMFSDLLQGALRGKMMDGIKDGLKQYFSQINGIPPTVSGMMTEMMPSFDAPTTDQIVYAPEYSWNVELGTHLTLADHTLSLDAAIFYSRIYDQQISRFAPTGLGRMMVNAGKSENYGSELSLRWQPVRALTLSGNYGYTHATFIDYDDGKGADYSGNYVPFVPMHNLNLDAAYTWALGSSDSDHRLTLGANITGTGDIYWTENNYVSQPFYSLYGARLTYEAPRFTINLWSKNLSNKRYNTFYFESVNHGFEQHGKPAQIGVDFTLHL